MPLWVPQKGRRLTKDNMGTVGSTTYGTSVTTGAASSTKGTAVDLLTLDFDAYWIEVYVHSYALAATTSDLCLDILAGDGSSGDVIIENILCGYRGTPGVSGRNSPTPVLGLPLYIPNGSHIWAQAAGDRVSTALRVGVRCFGGDGTPPFECGGEAVTYGIGTVPDGTAITPGASGAAGSHTQIVASTSRDHFCVFPGFQSNGDTTINLRNLAVAIGVGAATEEELSTIWFYEWDSAEQIIGPGSCWPHFADIPSGSRLTMRASNSGTNDGGYSGAIYAV